MKFLRFALSVRKKYKKKLRSILAKSVLMIQRFYKNKIRRRLFLTEKIASAIISLDCADAESVKL